MTLSSNDVDTYIGFVIRCGLTLADVTAAFALATTFSIEERLCICAWLKQNWK